jgi:hypothetical protein
MDINVCGKLKSLQVIGFEGFLVRNTSFNPYFRIL